MENKRWLRQQINLLNRRTNSQNYATSTGSNHQELATVLDVSNVALRQTRTERDALLAEVKSWAKECDRLTERHTKNRTNMHVLEAMRDLKAICPASFRNVEAL
ncbi:Uncharacterised protein [Klebsiella pneumoniae]|uniref:Uncharacterized protein n=1 Tax=Klebsiella pneumoniae TaxID=573 RepID=A0A378G068_KLEPN|nr:Uncharacterised protein [Klebsiella pneumoniae]